MSTTERRGLLERIESASRQNRISRRDFITEATAAGLTIAAASSLWTQSAAADTPKRGGTFRLGLHDGNTGDSLDPGQYQAISEIQLAHSVRSYLTEITSDNGLGGDMADAWSASPDARVWTFELNPNATFHDGRKFTARDAVASLNHHRGDDTTSAAKRAPPRRAGSVAKVTGGLCVRRFGRQLALSGVRRPLGHWSARAPVVKLGPNHRRLRSLMARVSRDLVQENGTLRMVPPRSRSQRGSGGGDMARKTRRTQRLKVVNPDCAGIDIGKDRHFVAVDPERTDDPVRSFGAFTRDLEAMTAWLASCGVTKVAMESTSVYWIPVYETLERAGFEVMLVPPRMTKQIGGRKSDVLDCQWIWQLMSYGLLRGAFRPGDAVCPLRSYVRQARRLTEDRARCVQHMQKALTEMNVRLDSVITDIVGLTGQRILRAIIDGERDPQRLAALRHKGIKADADTIAASLQGTWCDEHLFALEQAMQRYDFLDAQIEDCEARVMAEIERLTPSDDPTDTGSPDSVPGAGSDTTAKTSASAGIKKLYGQEAVVALAVRNMMGVDLTAIPTIGPGTALVIASEIGPDFSAFPSAQHFSSWLGVAPGTRISGGKPLPGKPPKAINPVGQSLKMAAMAARRSQTFIGAKHRARLARMDTPVAITATARELACLIYLMVTRGEEYVERGIDAYEKRRLNRKFAHLDRQAQKLGFQLVPTTQDSEKQGMPAA